MHPKLLAFFKSRTPITKGAAFIALTFSLLAGAAYGQTKVQGNVSQLQTYKQEMEQRTAYFVPVDKAAHFLADRKSHEDDAVALEAFLQDLPAIEKMSPDSEQKDFPQMANRWRLVKGILSNLRDIKVPDRMAYLMLVQLNTRGAIDSYKQRLVYVNQVVSTYAPEVVEKAQATAQVNQQIRDLLAQYKTSSNRSLMRDAFDIATTPRQAIVVEDAMLDALQAKMLVLNAKLNAGGESYSSGGDDSILSQVAGRRVNATVNSKLSVDAALDTKLYKPQLDHIVKAVARLKVTGRSRGNRPCGLMLVSDCDFDNEETKTFDQPIELVLAKSNGYRAMASYQMEWQAAAGGTGMASGMTFGGTKVFQATQTPVLEIVNIVLSPAPLTAMASDADTLSHSLLGGVHPVDLAFQRADRSTNVSKSQVAAGIYDEMARVSNEAGAKASAVDQTVQRRNSEASSVPADTSRVTAAKDRSDSWKLIRQYQGGFAEFGFDATHTIFLIRCSGGAEHKMYRDKNAKWGAIGLGGNNSFSSMEAAAARKCQ